MEKDANTIIYGNLMQVMIVINLLFFHSIKMLRHSYSYSYNQAQSSTMALDLLGICDSNNSQRTATDCFLLVHMQK